MDLQLMHRLPILLLSTWLICNADFYIPLAASFVPVVEYDVARKTTPVLRTDGSWSLRRSRRLQEQSPLSPASVENAKPVPFAMGQIPFEVDGAPLPVSTTEEEPKVVVSTEAKFLFTISGLTKDRIMGGSEIQMFQDVLTKFLRHHLGQRSTLYVKSTAVESQSVTKDPRDENAMVAELLVKVVAEYEPPPKIMLNMKLVDAVEHYGLIFLRKLSAASNRGGYFWRAESLQVSTFDGEDKPSISSHHFVRPEISMRISPRIEGDSPESLDASGEVESMIPPHASTEDLPQSTTDANAALESLQQPKGMYQYKIANDIEVKPPLVIKDDDIYIKPPVPAQEVAPTAVAVPKRLPPIDQGDDVLRFVSIIVGAGISLAVAAVLLLKATNGFQEDEPSSIGRRKKLDREQVLAFHTDYRRKDPTASSSQNRKGQHGHARHTTKLNDGSSVKLHGPRAGRSQPNIV